MNKTRILYIFLTLVIAAGGFLLLNNQVLAFGQITKPIVIGNALRGSEIDQQVKLLNDDDREVTLDLNVVGDIGEWASLFTPDDFGSTINSLILPAQTDREIVVRFNIPDDIPNGEYQGQINMKLRPEDTEESVDESVAKVALQISRQVTIKVIDQEEISLSASFIPETYNLKSGEFLKIRVIYRNEGNIRVSPQVQVKLRQGEKSYYNAIFPYPESEPAVKPLNSYEIPALEIPTIGLADGKYRAELQVINNNEAVAEESFQFSIGEVTGDGRSNLMSILTIALVVIIIGLLGGIMKIRQKRSARARVDDSSALAGSAKNSQKRANGGNSSQEKSGGKKNNKT